MIPGNQLILRLKGQVKRVLAFSSRHFNVENVPCHCPA